MNDNTVNTIECDAILFDLDGVLIDSTDCIIRHWQTWADKHGMDLHTIMRVAYGLQTLETMRLVAPQLDLVKEEKQFTINEILDTDGVIAIDGAKQLLSSIPEDAWTIVTSGSLDLVKARMPKAGLPMPKTIVTADDVFQGKPFPEPYLLGAKKLGINPQDCIVVEDAPAGIEAGKNAGMRVIAVASTHKREELFEKGADFVVDKLSDLFVGIPEKGERRLYISVNK